MTIEMREMIDEEFARLHSEISKAGLRYHEPPNGRLERVIAGLVATLFAVAIVLALSSCGASQRETTLKATLAATDAARVAFVHYDLQHQEQLWRQATDPASGKTAVLEYRAGEQLKVEKMLDGAYRAIAVATTLNDEQSLDAVLSAAKVLTDELKQLGVLKGQ